MSPVAGGEPMLTGSPTHVALPDWRRDPKANPKPIPCPECGREFGWEWTPEHLQLRGVPPHWQPPPTYPRLTEAGENRRQLCNGCTVTKEMDAHDTEHIRRSIEAGVNKRHLAYRFGRMCAPNRGEDWLEFAARIKDTDPPVFGVFGEDEHAVQRVRLWRPGAPGFLLEGPVGSGKSLLIAMLIRDLVRPEPEQWVERSLIRLIEMGNTPERAKILVETGRNRYFIPADRRRVRPIVAREQDIVQDTLRGSSLDRDPLKQYATVDVLVIDDLGVAIANTRTTKRQLDYARDTLGRLIDYRYNEDLPLLCTTNLSADELRAAFGGDPRTWSRLREMCPQTLTLGAIPAELVDAEASWRTPGARRPKWMRRAAPPTSRDPGR